MGDTLDSRMGRGKEDQNICLREPAYKLNSVPKNIGHIDTEIVNQKPKPKTWPPKFKSRDLFFAVVGLILFILDLISDWRLTLQYLSKNQMLLFGLTIGFILGPSVFSGLISIVWYTMDHRGTNERENSPESDVEPSASNQINERNEQQITGVHNYKSETVAQNEVEHNNTSSNIQHVNLHNSDIEKESDSLHDKGQGVSEWNHNTVSKDYEKKEDDIESDTSHNLLLTQGGDTVDSQHGETTVFRNKRRLCLRIVVSFLQLGRIFRSVEYIIYMIKSWRSHPSRQEHLRLKAINQKQDAAILGLIDGFLESALQLILQLYLSVAVPIEMDFFRVVTLLLSLGSTTLTHTVFYRTNRKCKPDKPNVSYKASLIYFLWRICELSPRFLLLSLSVHCLFPWIFIAFFVHILCLFVCFSIHNPNLYGICPNKCFKSIFLFIMSYIGLFCYVNFEEGKTKYRTVLYYIVFYLENTAMAAMIIWYSHSHSMILNRWTYSTLSFLPGCLFHVLFQILYYKAFHPNRTNL